MAPVRGPHRYVSPDGGQIVWVEMTITPLGADATGQPLHLCTVDDITERRLSEGVRTRDSSTSSSRAPTTSRPPT